MTLIVPPPTFSDNDLSTGYTQIGAPAFTPDLINPNNNVAIDADGNNDALVASQLVSSGISSFACSCWIRADLTLTVDFILAQFKGTSTNDIHFWTSINNLGQIDFDIYTNASGVNLNGKSTLTVSGTVVLAKWYHLGFICNLGIQEILVNGLEASYAEDNVNVGSGFTTTGSQSANTTIANRQFQPSSFDGRIARVRFWNNQQITIPQMQQEYQNELYKIPVQRIVKPIIDPILNPTQFPL